MKVYFVPDVHLQEHSPRSRKDAFPTTILEKLEFIVDYVNKNKGMCYFLGDLFNAVNMPMIYFYRVVDVFKKFEQVPNIIVGNHDYPRDREDMLPRTPLGLLMNIGLINIMNLSHVVDDKVAISGFSYWEKIEPALEDSYKHICLAHCFYENGYVEEHNLTDKKCRELGYDYYVLGHDHTPYQTIEKNSYKVYRVGSISRGTADDNQLTRDYVSFLEYDTDLDTFTEIQIPCLPARDVFNEQVLARKKLDKVDTREVLDNLVFTSNDSIYDVLDKSEQDPKIKEIVEQYLQASGIFRVNRGEDV